MNTKEDLKSKGFYRAFSLPENINENSKIVSMLREFSRGKTYLDIKTLIKSGALLDYKTAENIVPTTGRNVIARRLAGDTTYSLEVDWGALGSGTGAFTTASTQLGTEVFRKQASSQAYEDNIAYIDWFIEAGDVANQTFTEFGAFIDGSAAADSGQAWSLLLTGLWQKSGSLFVSATYSITQ